MFFLFQRAKIINYLQIEVYVYNLFSGRKIDLPILKISQRLLKISQRLLKISHRLLKISHRRTSLKYLPLKTTRATVAKIHLFYSLE